jgi:uncharacterized protein (TIGR03083 family)
MGQAVYQIANDIPRTPFDRASDTVQAELAAVLAVLRDLSSADWRRPTPCTGWTVHDVVAHMVGQVEELARPDRLITRIRRARRLRPDAVLDAHNDCQVQDRRHVSDARLVADLDRWSGKAIRAARRMPAPVRRRMPLSRFFPEGKLLPEDSFDYLVRVLMSRDPWMHRLDIAAATGRTPVLNGHDALIVGQVVHDLALAWAGPPVTLVLSGPAGGRWLLGPRRPPIATVTGDAVEYLRLLSGRHTGYEPTADGDPAAAAALLSARVVF